jgi:hypothetical protein
MDQPARPAINLIGGFSSALVGLRTKVGSMVAVARKLCDTAADIAIELQRNAGSSEE